MNIKQLLREPFVHFFILGVLLFGLDAMLRDQSESASKGEIVVTTGRIENLAAVFEKTWQRPPTLQELQGLVDTYIRDEALFREGVAMGVDQDDTVIRRRVRQKVDFLVDDLASPAEPEEAELQAWLDDNQNAYAIPPIYTFIQIYLNPDRHRGQLDAEVDRLLSKLRSAEANIDYSTLGDATLLESAYANYRADQVANGFGGQFAYELEAVPVGQWSGPLESAFGVHLVYVVAKTPARAPELAEVRNAVERDWRRDKREAAVTAFHEQTVASYDVTVEWPEFVGDSTEASE